MKKILMIAGPNGAGKTTTTLELIAKSHGLYECINADEIAKGLAPLHPESMALTASKLMIQRFKDLLTAGKSFAFETTGSGTNYIKHLKLAKSDGYEINFIFLWLATPEQALGRVAERVRQGGHDVPEATIRRRYYAGIKNLMKFYLPLADTAIVMDVTWGMTEVIAHKMEDRVKISNQKIWEQLEQCAHER